MLHNQKSHVFGPSQSLFRSYTRVSIDALKEEVKDAIEREDYESFENLINEHPILINLEYSSKQQIFDYICTESNNIDLEFVHSALELLVNFGVHVHSSKFYDALSPNFLNKLLEKDDYVFEKYFPILEKKIQTLLKNTTPLGGKILEACLWTLQICKPHNFHRAELFELYFTVNSIFITVEKSPTIPLLIHTITEFLSAREDMLCGERLDYGNPTLANELTASVVEIVFPEEKSLGDCLLYNALTRDRGKRWKDPFNDCFF